MKTLLLAGLLVPTLSFAQVCKRAVDKKKVVLFIDTNQGEKEIATARAAACQRGETFVSIPRAQTSQSDLQKDLKAAFEDMKKTGAAPVSLLVSGHDGGGQFSGDKGSISRSNILSTLKTEYPEFAKSIESIYLLGCYTGVKSEIFAWLGVLENLKLIGGYEGSAPLASRPAGFDYIQGLMTEEKALSQKSQSVALRRTLDGLKNMNVLNSAVYVKAEACVEDKVNEYYYRPKPHAGAKFEPFSTKDCVEKVRTLKATLEKLVPYYEGATPIPTNTASGPLRELYNYFRGGEHCFKGKSGVPNADQILGLLFYPGYAQNIAQFLDADMKKLQTEVDGLTIDDYRKNIASEIQDAEAKRKELNEKYGSVASHPALKAAAEQRLKTAEAKLTALATSPRARELSAFFEDNDEANVDLMPASIDPKVVKEYLGYMKDIEDSYDELQFVGAEAAQTLKYKLDALDNRVKTLQQTKFTENDFKTYKSLFWFPTAENVKDKSRKEHMDGLHRLYGSTTLSGLPESLRQRIRVASRTSANLLNNLNCLPLAWHEYKGPSSVKPSCGVANPETISGKLNVYNNYFDTNQGRIELRDAD